MPHDLPLADMMFHSDSLDPLSKAFPLVHTTEIAGSRGPVNQWAGRKVLAICREPHSKDGCWLVCGV